MDGFMRPPEEGAKNERDRVKRGDTIGRQSVLS